MTPHRNINEVGLAGNKFIMNIDEGVASIRGKPVVQQEYLEYLRILLKGRGITVRYLQRLI